MRGSPRVERRDGLARELLSILKMISRRVVSVMMLAALGAAVSLACGGSDAGVGSPDAAADDASVGDANTSVDSSTEVDASTDSSTDGSADAASPPACASLPLPPPCGSAATVPASGSTYGTTGGRNVSVETLDNPHPKAPRGSKISVFLPDGLPAKVPVLFFSHAFGATDPKSYETLFRMLASNGYAVVHVPYPTSPITNSNADRYECLWAGFTEAVDKFPRRLDATRAGFVGHSFGGGATAEMARRGFVEEGWGSNGRLMFIMAPWFSWGSGYETMPSDVRTVIQTYAEEAINDPQIAVDDIWNKLPANTERSWILIRSDACGACGLNATHTQPMTAQTLVPNPETVVNAIDTGGIWNRIHALAAYAFDKQISAKPIAFGTDTSMGNWAGCGGRAVRRLESATTPILSPCATYQYPASKRCESADPGFPCP